MPRFAWSAAILSFFSLIFMAACGGGGGSSNTIGPPASVELTPTSLSLNRGEVASISVGIKDANSNQILTITPIFSSDNPNITVSTNGLVCAGKWDSLTTPVVCQTTETVGGVVQPLPIGTAKITAKAGDITSASLPVSVHEKVTSITLSTTAVVCTSQTVPGGATTDRGTQQFTAIARDANGNDITSTVGALTWASANVNVATVDANGLAKAVRPGKTTIFASVSGVNSLPLNFTTCPPQSIAISETGSNPPVTSLALTAPGTKTLAPAILDILGQPFIDIPLTYTTSQPAVATVSGTFNATVTAVAPGSAAIVAACLPPACNAGLLPVYSNVVTVAVTGTSASTVYVTGSNATTIVPIDTTTNAAGTPITLPTVTVNGTTTPLVLNSMVFSKTGGRAYIGADRGIVVLDSANNTIASTLTTMQGRVLAVSGDGVRVIISDPANGKVFVFNTTANTFETLSIPAATGAAFTTDDQKAFIVSGSTLFVYAPNATLRSVPLAGAANDVTMLTQGSLGYIAGGGASSAITVHATCDNSAVTGITTPATPSLIASSFDSTRVFAVDDTSIEDVSVNAPSEPCPPSVTNALNTVSFGVGAFTPRQLIVTSDGMHAFVTTPDVGGVLAYDVAAGAATAIPLAGGATFATTGGITLDSKNLYVGAAGANDVHRIDVATGADAQQIAVNLKKPDGSATTPDLVAVRPK